MKYWRIFLGFVRTGIVADLEYRANLVARAIGDLIWYLAQIATFEVLFRHTTQIGDWNLAQTRVFLGVLFVTDGIFVILFNVGLERMTENVRRGDLDLLLVKPINSQFMLSLYKFNSSLIVALLLGLSWLIGSLIHLPDFNWLRVLWLFLLIPAGVVTVYCTRLFMATTSVIFTRSENLQFMWYQIYRLGIRPDSIYSPWLKFILITILPVGLVANIPSHALLDAPHFGLFTWAVAWSVGLLYLSHRFWQYALKHYSSASS